jgi:protein-S-isoprenylcysteine O-methyltransferase Ste14
MQQPQKSLVFVFLQVLCLLALVLSGPLIPSRFIPQLMLLVGISVGLWALACMRQNLTPLPDVKKHTRLITDGPYEIIRHPMYSAMILITFGLVLNYLTLFRLSVFVVLVIVLVLKLAYEEELLTKRFHHEYITYKKHSFRIIPYIY